MELLLAAKSGDLTHVKELLEEGVDINVTNSSGASALILAAEKMMQKWFIYWLRQVQTLVYKLS